MICKEWSPLFRTVMEWIPLQGKIARLKFFHTSLKSATMLLMHESKDLAQKHPQIELVFVVCLTFFPILQLMSSTLSMEKYSQCTFFDLNLTPIVQSGVQSKCRRWLISITVSRTLLRKSRNIARLLALFSLSFIERTKCIGCLVGAVAAREQ